MRTLIFLVLACSRTPDERPVASRAPEAPLLPPPTSPQPTAEEQAASPPPTPTPPEKRCELVFTAADAERAHGLLDALESVCTYDGVYVRGWQMEMRWESSGAPVAFTAASASCIEAPWVVGGALAVGASEAARTACPKAAARLAEMVAAGGLPIPTAPGTQ